MKATPHNAGIPVTSSHLGFVTLRGRLDAVAAREVEQHLVALATSDGIVGDMTDVAYVDSSGLRMLLRAAKCAAAAGRVFCLCGLQDAVRVLFERSGLDAVITTYRSHSDVFPAIS